LKTFSESDDPPRLAAHVIRGLSKGETLADGANRPFIHRVDGGISNNVGMHGVLDALQRMWRPARSWRIGLMSIGC
jgi:NTE family protein